MNCTSPHVISHIHIGTDTSLSSDEAIDRAVQAATRRHQEKRYSGVPESKLTTTTFTADQVVHMTTTESDDPQVCYSTIVGTIGSSLNT